LLVNVHHVHFLARKVVSLTARYLHISKGGTVLSLNFKTVRDIELKNKRVLLRADFNVPLENGRITSDYRIARSLPTIKYILDHGAAGLVIIAHLGRPKNKNDKDCSLASVVERLEQLLGRSVEFASDCIGPEVRQFAQSYKLVMFENLRFHPAEEANDEDFAKQIVQAAAADIFVQDGFGVVHRAHASTSAITKLLPSVGGLLLEQEVETIESLMANPPRPFTAVVGGVKVSDKIDVLERFIEKADCVAVGGALANNFLHAEKIPLGKSLVDKEDFHLASELLAKARRAERERNFQFMVPVDGVASTDIGGKAKTRVIDFAADTLADIQSYPAKPPRPSFHIGHNEMLLDIGPISASRIAGAVGLSQAVVWAGTLGVTETPGLAGAAAPFAHGTKMVVEAVIGSSNRHKNKAFSLVGGGDTVAYVESQKLTKDFSFVSTGGSASLELMAGHNLPGIDSLAKK
jgi:3-phosphoglycerate kinase